MIKSIPILCLMTLLSCGFPREIRTEILDSKNERYFFFENDQVMIAFHLIGQDNLLVPDLIKLNRTQIVFPLDAKRIGEVEEIYNEFYLDLFPILQDKLRKGKVTIYDKRVGTYIDRYRYQKVRGKLGGETDVFSFLDHTVFYEIIVSMA